MTINAFVNPVVYVVFLTGVVLIFFETFELYFRKVRRRSLLKQSGKKKGYSSGLMIYLDDMLKTVFPNGGMDPAKLLGITAGIFLFVFIFLYSVLSFRALLPAVFFSAVPVILLRFRLEKLRNRGSKEAERLVTDLLNYYRINHKNIFSGMEEFIRSDADGCDITRGMIFQLLISLRNTRNADAIRSAADRFAFGIKTNWAFMLSQCIYAAAAEGIDISESLEDILEQLKIARTLEEEKKRANAESSRMVTFLVPFSYVSTALIGVFMMDISPRKLLINQFGDSVGMLLIIVIVGLFLINMLLLDAVKNGRFDY